MNDDEQTGDGMSPLYVVGVGASAGGLEALQEFFRAMPMDTGAAFVVIQHLSPDYKSLMSELLARCTSMPVMTAEEEQPVEPDHVYLIPPRKNLVISKGKLYLHEQTPVKGVNLAIDAFFRSLATAQRKYAVAVVLSGAGSDGTLGIRDVKEAGGMIMVQDPQTAKFGSMPNNAIATGLADYVLAPEQMGDALQGYLKHPYINKEELISLEVGAHEDALARILAVIRDYAKVDFSRYKDNTILRRLERRVSVNRCSSLEEYLPLFLESDKEKNILYKEFLIGVTSFFRDREAFDSLVESVFPQIRPVTRQIRVWSVACSTGEEVYSLGMLLLRHIHANNLDYDIKIFATDIDKEALSVASQGFYPDSVVSDIDPSLLSRYFSRVEGGWRAGAELRKQIIFSQHNALQDPPFSKLDLVVCRNLFIYLKPQTQQELLSTFYYALNSGGYLFMGNSESIGELDDAFQILDRRWKIYRRRDGYKPLLPINPGVNGGRTLPHVSGAHTAAPTDCSRMDKIIRQAFAAISPPMVIINENGNILHMENDLNGILVFHPGAFSQNLFHHLPDSLGLFVNGVLRKLKSGTVRTATARATGMAEFVGQDVIVTGYALQGQHEYFYALTFQWKPLGQAQLEAAPSRVDGKEEIDKYIKELEQDLQSSKENLQATVEELETSNEELQSSNEELVASNEELQSTNEELQSVNEELYTVNSEYQVKIEELLRLSNDLDNMLTNTQIGALYLDNSLHIRKVTPVVCKITHIMESDVGRPIAHIDLMDGYPSWSEDIRYVKNTLHPVDREVLSPSGGCWMVRIRPYRTEINAVEGIIMTFVEASGLRQIYRQDRRLGRLPSPQKLLCWQYDLGTDLVTLNQNCESSAETEDEKRELLISSEEFFRSMHPDDMVHVRSALDECEHGECPDCEVAYRAKNDEGRQVWYYLYMIVARWNVEGRAAELCGLTALLEELELPEAIREARRKIDARRASYSRAPA